MACITESVSRFFEPSQPQRVPPGLETNVNPSPTYGGISTKSRRTSVSVSNIGRPCDLELSFWYIKVLMNSYHHLKLDIYQRSPITQLRVYYVQISVLSHRCEACAIFSAIETIDSESENNAKFRKRNHPCLIRLLSAILTGSKVTSGSSILTPIGWKFTSFLRCLYTLASITNLAEGREHVLGRAFR